MIRPPIVIMVSVLALGMVSVSFGAILVRWSQEAPSLTIAFYRMGWAWLLLSPFYLSRTGWGRTPIGRADSSSPWWYLAAGTALALHFAFWIGSLRFTTVAVSSLLVNTSPVLVAAISLPFLRERLSNAGALGILLAMLGASTLVWQDMSLTGDARGPLLALGGAAMLAVYLAVGRRVRRGRGLIEYVWPTYGIAALLLLALTVVSGTALRGFGPSTYLSLFLLGLIPQCLGHTSYNWALRYLAATVVSSLVLAEPILATFLAWLLLGESLTVWTLLGGILVAGGLLLVVRWGDAGGKTGPRFEIAAGLLVEGDRVWIQQRPAGGHLAGYWEFPGGKIEPGETPTEALRRELGEELGISIPLDLAEPFHVEEHSYPERDIRIHFFLCRVTADLIVEASGKWERIAGLDEDKFPPANRTVLARLRERAAAPGSGVKVQSGQPPDRPVS